MDLRLLFTKLNFDEMIILITFEWAIYFSLVASNISNWINYRVLQNEMNISF